MPRFYGDRIDIIIEDGQTFEDAMKITTVLFVLRKQILDTNHYLLLTKIL